MCSNKKDKETLLLVRSSKIFQHPESFQIPKEVTINHNNKDLINIIKELDRRCSQLWDKVVYERDKGYVKYIK